MNRKYEPLDKIWRKPPVKLEDCRQYESSTILEDFDPSLGAEHFMPLVSKKVFEKADFEASSNVLHELYGETSPKSKPRASVPTFKPAAASTSLSKP